MQNLVCGAAELVLRCVLAAPSPIQNRKYSK